MSLPIANGPLHVLIHLIENSKEFILVLGSTAFLGLVALCVVGVLADLDERRNG